MYKKIIVPIAMDRVPQGEATLKRALSLLDAGGEILMLNVVEDLNAYAQGYMIVDFPQQMLDDSIRHAERTLDALKQKYNVPGRVLIEVGGASGRIMELAETEKADLVIIASHQPGLSDYFIGSTASRVAAHCHSAVLIDR
ncbi:universal stress protein [Xaviernesmea oryzae]|uniref:Universal stress protein n=1 Tax=Xaviernesmea oryzae TaxID=464029 RepID=A0A1Q9B1R0_9HYPH|nr:universal stress protein [Xaviernesmea oryzae]OLP61916.1 universal stress protein [Xaviernesmea oryzae]SEL75724.1 Nucleotide-binding universal stress protein, UspA family [Xaviernesmea oryzae]